MIIKPDRHICLRNSRGSQRYVFFFLVVVFGCWLADSDHVSLGSLTRVALLVFYDMFLALASIMFWSLQGIDVKSMGRIFIGLVKCGAWGCFDEFNRLEEAVLSSVSMQIQTIQAALKSRASSTELLGRQVSCIGYVNWVHVVLYTERRRSDLGRGFETSCYFLKTWDLEAFMKTRQNCLTRTAIAVAGWILSGFNCSTIHAIFNVAVVSATFCCFLFLLSSFLSSSSGPLCLYFHWTVNYFCSGGDRFKLGNLHHHEPSREGLRRKTEAAW